MALLTQSLQMLDRNETLLDGTPLIIRHIRPEDSARLQAFHKRLKFESNYLRFHRYRDDLSYEEILHLCTMDYIDRMAFVATCVKDDQEHIIGVVRYDRCGSDHPNCAAFAIAVEDAYQKRGLGTLLLRQLVSYARDHAIKNLVATFLLENVGFLKLLKRCTLSLNLVSCELGKLRAYIRLDGAPVS